jgi:hypothetical protein
MGSPEKSISYKRVSQIEKMWERSKLNKFFIFYKADRTPIQPGSVSMSKKVIKQFTNLSSAIGLKNF